MKNNVIEKALEIKLEHTCCYSGSCHTCWYNDSSNGRVWCKKEHAYVSDPDSEKGCYVAN